MPTGVVLTNPWASPRAPASSWRAEVLVEVVREGLGPRRVDVEQDQPLDALGEQRVGHCRAGAARAHLHHALARRVGQAAPKALGEAQAVGVVADAPAIAQHHGVHRADAARLGGEFVEQGDDRLLAGEGDVQPGEAEVAGGGEQELQVVRRLAQRVEIDQPVQIADALGVALALVQGRGPRRLDAGTDQAGENRSRRAHAAASKRSAKCSRARR